MRLTASPKIFQIRIFCLLVFLLSLIIWFGYTSRSNISFFPKSVAATDRMASFPKTILWAWERPERLSFINPKKVGVAFLAQTLYLRGDTVTVRFRLQPLEVPPQTFLIAVVRIESDRLERPLLSSSQRSI